MSPLTVRRYRAERLLRDEFEGLRARVIARVQRRLRASGACLDQSDLEACYAQAWQGLYAVVLEGQEIANPAGWLTLVTFRRALEEHRSRRALGRTSRSRADQSETAQPNEQSARSHSHECDFAAQLDDRVRLRALFEGLRCRLSAREREAATFCYLQGLSRSEAAARMGVSEPRMRKLMDGDGCGAAGVAGKVGALVATIEQGGWCEAQGSLMRAFAYGILDPQGERYRLALAHRDACPACRAYVRSLRGLAATVPPVLLPWGLGAGALVRAAAMHGGRAGAVGGAGAQVSPAVGGALTASGAAAGGAAAPGSWLLAGGTLAGKLATGCLLALSVGASCIALSGLPHRAHAPSHAQHRSAHLARYAGAPALEPATPDPKLAAAVAGARSVGAAAHVGAAAPLERTGARRASREFGPEQALSGASVGAPSTLHAAGAHSASAGAQTLAGSSSAGAGGGGGEGVQRSSSEGGSKAAREFAPG